MKSLAQKRLWGLYPSNQKDSIPLKSLDIKINIIHNIARVFYTQEYFNETESLLETEFFFPISPDACFDSFEAKFNNTVIQGVVKAKETAQLEYKIALEAKKTVAYSEINEETGDIMKVLIGNIPPGTLISVKYSYIQPLTLSMGKFWTFRLFSTITSRYNSNPADLQKKDITLLSNYPIVAPNNSGGYPWHIEAEIQSPSPITFMKSPSHNVEMTYGNEGHTCLVKFLDGIKYSPNKDFALVYANNGTDSKVNTTLTPTEEGYCAMISVVADFDTSTNEEAYDNLVKAKPVENSYSMSSVRGEYVFLIDRSGSMDGDRIKMAVESLVLFLQSLPKDSFYNVISFGSEYYFLHSESVAYSAESLEASLKKIKTFKADMGGTEILGALQKLFESSQVPGYPRFVFLLTDGDVSNTNAVIQLISKHSSKNKTKVFTLGLGNGCSAMLIKEGAEAGRGKSEFVGDNAEIYEKVIGLLDASLSPCFSEISFQAANFDAVVENVSPNPATIPFLLGGEPATFFLFLRKAAFQQDQKMPLKLRMYDSRIHTYREIEIILDASHAIENGSIPKLGIHDIIKRLENENITADKDYNKIFWNEKDLLNLSTSYGILCRKTAFICEVAEKIEGSENLTSIKTIVPSTKSQDYEGSFSKDSPRATSINSGSMMSSLQQAISMRHKANSTPKNARARSSSSDKSEDEEECDYEEGEKDNDYEPIQRDEENEILEQFEEDSSRKLEGLGLKCHYLKNEDDLDENTNIVECMMPAPQQAHFFEEELCSSPPPATFMSEGEEKLAEEESKTVDHNKNIQSSLPRPSKVEYLPVLAKQNFDGFWSPSDPILLKSIVGDNAPPVSPHEFSNEKEKQEKIWTTILVMVWLETFFENEKKAWKLIHQKAREWLLTQGVVYNEVRGFGFGFMKT